MEYAYMVMPTAHARSTFTRYALEYSLQMDEGREACAP